MQARTHDVDAGEEEGGVDIGNLLEETGGSGGGNGPTNSTSTRLLSSLMVIN